MKRYGLLSSIAAGLALAAVIASCSSDTKTVESLAAPDSSSSAVASLNLNGGGWSPAVEAAAQTNDKVTVCHSGNGKHYSQITVSAQGARVHLGDSKSGKGGHDGDYRVSATTTCPPSATAGNVQVCKVAGVGVSAGTSFTFTLTAEGTSKTVTVAAGAAPAGTCVSGGDYRVGTTVSIRETAQQGVNATSIVANPAGAQQGTPDLAAGSTTIVTGSGATTVTFTNNGATGTLVICKVAGTGVSAGTSFTFAVAGQTATVAAGAAPNGTCSTTPLTIAAGNVTVTESATTGVNVSAVTATGTGGNALVSSDLANRSATVTITAGQATTVTFTNSTTAATTGTLVICKIGGTGVSAGTAFTFTAGGQTATVAAGAAPNGTCSTPLTLPAGPVTVTETAVAGTSVQSITGTPPVTNVNLAGRSATAQINASQESRVTFTNVAP